MGQLSDSDIPLETVYHGDRPPSYNDVIDPSSSNPDESSIPGARNVVWDEKAGIVTLSSSLTESPRRLYQLIAQQALLPPRQYIHIQGHKDNETDFNFTLDVTPTLLHLGEDNREWHDIRVVRDGDGQEAYRGAIIPTLHWEEPSSLKVLRQTIDLEDGDENPEDQILLGATVDGSNEGTPTLMGWCERFCRDPARVKSFTFKRELKGFDLEPMRSELRSYLRSLNYRGKIEITASIPNNFITVYSPHWINRLRNNSFVWWLCVLLQLWIVMWPVIAILERHFEVVHSEWRSSREVEDSTAPSGRRKIYAHGRDEAKLADFWAAAVMQLAWDQRDGAEILTEADLTRLERRGQERMERIGRSVPSDRNGVADSTAEDTQASRRGPAIPGVGAGGYDFQAGWGVQAGWGANTHSTTS